MSPESIQHSREHEAAFLMPVPLFFFGAGLGGCVAYGSVVQGNCAAVGSSTFSDGCAF